MGQWRTMGNDKLLGVTGVLNVLYIKNGINLIKTMLMGKVELKVYIIYTYKFKEILKVKALCIYFSELENKLHILLMNRE